MLFLITGGAASGKSALAERLCTVLGGSLLYVATMQPFDQEGMQRVKKHRAQRACYGFETLECYDHLEMARQPGQYGTLLLECLSNLCANEMFGQSQIASANEVAWRVGAGIRHLQGWSEHLVLVSNEVFGGAEHYEGNMAAYLAALGRINREAAALADCVVESVCGLPLVYKGKEMFPL